MKKPDIDEIMQNIKAKYGSLEEPRFDFVLSERNRGNVIFQLQAFCSENGYSIQNLSYGDDEMCFSYWITLGNIRYILELSMIGPYVFLIKHDEKENKFTLITTSLDAINEFEKKLVELLKDLVLMDKEILLAPVKLKLFVTAPERTMIYHALFSDNDIIPL
ncbi:MAG: hypothetical protein HZA48_11520 [Planctomycetes bacterium]|nr:hypothetical protein [Planctomycetota bacterium]